MLMMKVYKNIDDFNIGQSMLKNFVRLPMNKSD